MQGLKHFTNRMLMSHEFNTALSSILNNAELLCNKKLSQKQTVNCANDIYSSGQRIAEFISTLLNSAKKSPTINHNESSNLLKTKKRIRKIHHLSVLMVEDEPIIQRVHGEMLKSLGCKFEIANDGYQALEMLEGNHNYEVILMDIGLPHMDGIQTVEKIRQQKINQSIPIVGLTAFPLDDVMEQCKAAGFNNLVAKPMSLQTLENILNDIAIQQISYQII